MFDEIRDAVVIPAQVTIKGVKYPCLVWVGGDMAFISHVFGLGAHFDCTGHNCIWCEVHSKDLHRTTKSQERTLRRIYNLGHMPMPDHCSEGVPQFPFECPGCKKSFNCQGDVDADKACGPKTSAQETAYRHAHFGVSHHKRPLIDVPLWFVILCMLHMVLSVVKTVWLKTVVVHVHDFATADTLNLKLKTLGCHVR